jgi:hypothetical protein
VHWAETVGWRGAELALLFDAGFDRRHFLRHRRYGLPVDPLGAILTFGTVMALRPVRSVGAIGPVKALGPVMAGLAIGPVAAVEAVGIRTIVATALLVAVPHLVLRPLLIVGRTLATPFAALRSALRTIVEAGLVEGTGLRLGAPDLGQAIGADIFAILVIEVISGAVRV